MDIKNKKIMFLGFGAVAKCVLHYFSHYFVFNKNRVVLVDKSKDAFTPNLRFKKIVLAVDATNFKDLVDSLGFKRHDIIIDLTTSTVTYYFIKMCLLRGFHYINTSIEDVNDAMLGTSIDCQQKMVQSIASRYPKKSTVLTECGQNPGLIQHYILHAFKQMHSMKNKGKCTKKAIQKVITDFKVGSILMSEIDNMVSTTPLKPSIIYNTWSVAGYLFEATDKTELVRGKTNTFVQPYIAPHKISNTTKIYEKMCDSEYDVLFMKENAMKTTLNSICPVLTPSGNVEFVNYRGKLIHHGEIFEMARYFGENAPFMSYVYKNSPYVDQTIEKYKKSFQADDDDVWLYVNQENNFKIFDGTEATGHDSIGCTIFCGEKEVERIFWCGSILSSADVSPEYTPTIVQVAVGVLSGLSFIVEHQDLGWIEPTDIDNDYMLQKSVPLLGKFFFKEIPVDQFNGPIKF